jgi:hypothetical protein
MSDAAMNEAIEDRAGGIGGFSRAYLQRRYMVLFYSLLLTMVTVPASGVLGIDSAFIDLFLAANLLIAVIPLGTKRARHVLLFILLAKPFRVTDDGFRLKDVDPADNKGFTRVLVAAAVIEALSSLDLQYPKVSDEKLKELAAAKRAL